MYRHMEMPNVPIIGQTNYMPESTAQWHYRTHGDGRFAQYGLEPARFMKDNRHMSGVSLPHISDPPQYDSRFYRNEPPPPPEPEPYYEPAKQTSLIDFGSPRTLFPRDMLCVPEPIKHPWFKPLLPHEDFFLKQREYDDP